MKLSKLLEDMGTQTPVSAVKNDANKKLKRKFKKRFKK